MELAGNTILTTGGATAIGFELARVLAERGKDVVICGRRSERVELTKELPNLDMLVNNAGVQHVFDFRDASQLPNAGKEIAI